MASFLFATLAFAAKDYENFDLPKKDSIQVPVSHLAYKTERMQLTGKDVKLKEKSFDAAEFLAAKETFLTEKRDETIKLLRQQMDSGYKANRDNMLLRLGQLYSEKYMELGLAETELYTRQIEEFEKKSATDKNAKRPGIDNSRSKRYLKDALTLFYSIEKEYPRHPKIDEVIFFIGFVEMESGNTVKGSAFLERVVRLYPRSRKFDEALVYLGDYYFDKVRFRDSIAKFNILLRRPDTPLYHYAVYKLAWCELNTSQQVKGLRRMKGIVASLQGATEKAKFNLREQALKDLVVFYAETEAVDEAIDFFSEMQGKDKALENLKLIADILRSKARDEAAIRAYTKLLLDFSDSPDAPKLHLGLYEARARLGQTEKAVDALVAAIQRYGATSQWAKKFPKEKATDVRETLDALSSEGLRVAMFHHSSAQKSSNRAAFGYALKLYSALLDNFPQHADRKKIAFYRGEILYAQGKWLDAANSYMDAAKVPPKDKVTDDSVYAALLALDRLSVKNEKLERFSKDEQKNMSLTPEAIPSEELRFIEIAEFYLKEYPKGDRVVDVRYRIASIYYRFHHFDKAQAQFRDIALNHPRHRSAPTAAHIVLDIYNIKKDYESLDTSAAQFAGMKDLGDAQFKAEMAQISGEINFKRVEKLEGENKWRLAGESYFKFHQASPTGPLAEKSLYNAYVSFEKGGDVVRAAETSKLFIAKFPKSEYSRKMTLALAKSAERQYDFDLAQRLYEDFHKKFPKDKESRKALYNAAVFAELLEKNSQALRLYDEYMKERVSTEERRAILVSQAKIHRRSGQWDKMSAIYRRLARDAGSMSDRLGYLGELARQYEKGGKYVERNSVMNEIRAIYVSTPGKKPTGSGVPYAAEAQFKALSKAREKYEGLKLRFPPEDLLYLLKRKQSLLTKLAKDYDGVVDVGVPEWGVAALFEKGSAYENFVLSYRAVQVPGNYQGDTKTDAEKALKDIDAKLVAPLESKSQEIFKSCATRASEFHVATEYSSKCRQKIKAEALAVSEPTGILPQPSYWSTRWVGGSER